MAGEESHQVQETVNVVVDAANHDRQQQQLQQQQQQQQHYEVDGTDDVSATASNENKWSRNGLGEEAL